MRSHVRLSKVPSAEIIAWRSSLATHAHNITALHPRSAPRTTPARPALRCFCPRRTANPPVACCARPVVWSLPAHSPLRAQALRIALHHPPHAEHRLQYTASNVGTPQCPALWPWLPRLSLRIPFPEEPSVTRPTATFLLVHDHARHRCSPTCLFSASERTLLPRIASTAYRGNGFCNTHTAGAGAGKAILCKGGQMPGIHVHCAN